jgi:PIN domain nuclease of toxin-antitoxin system
LLLDTHAFLWWLEGNRRLSRNARIAVEDPETAVFVSAASAWEIATKFRLGKLSGAAAVVDDIAVWLRFVE